MLTFKGLPSASPIPRASKLSAKCVVVVTRPHPSTTCLVWENFTICYEYWVWIRPINDGYVTITTRILFTRPKGGLSETPFERKVRVTWRVTHSSTKLPLYLKKLDSKKYKSCYSDIQHTQLKRYQIKKASKRTKKKKIKKTSGMKKKIGILHSPSLFARVNHNYM